MANTKLTTTIMKHSNIHCQQAPAKTKPNTEQKKKNTKEAGSPQGKRVSSTEKNVIKSTLEGKQAYHKKLQVFHVYYLMITVRP